MAVFDADCSRNANLFTAGRQAGGARIVYYYLDERIPLYALLAYAKSDQGDLTPDEKRTVAALASALKATAKEA